MRYLFLDVSVVVGLALFAFHCGSSSDEGYKARDPGGSGSATTSGAGGSGATGGGVLTGTGGTGGTPPPPEREVERAFEAPVATERFVWAVNPKTGRVAVIDAKSYQVKTVAAGQGPTFIAAIPGKDDRAIVLNVLSNDATYFAQKSDGTIDQKTFQVAPRANSWAIAPNARIAIAWTDVTRVSNPDSIEGFQQISVINLETTAPASRAPVRTVGFRPSSISFSADASRAFAVTEDGITIVDLSVPADPKVTKTIKLDAPVATNAVDAVDGGESDDGGASTSDAAPAPDAPPPIDAGSDSISRPDVDAGPPKPPPPGKADVSITPNGQFAILRRENSAVVTIVNLSDGSRWSWTLSGAVTDLDLADTGDRAVAVVRSESRVAILPVPGMGSAAFDDVVIAGETIGSVVLTPKGNTALLYTNALAVDRLTIVQLVGSPRYEVVDLHAPVLSVVASPTAQHAVVIHNPLNGQAFKSAGAFSVVPLSSEHAAVIQPTDAPPLSVAMSPAGDRALIPVRDDPKRIFGVYLARMPSLVTERFALASPPMSAGFVGADGQAFIAQEHPEGRVTFIDSASGLVRTITGFELGASVVVWSRDGGQ